LEFNYRELGHSPALAHGASVHLVPVQVLPNPSPKKTFEITGLLALGQELPQSISIGIGFLGPDTDIDSYQVRDYVPTEQMDNSSAGGAENFLRFIREDLMPFISSEYRVDPKDRCFLGYSLAGLFGSYTLFHHPDTFLRYIISSAWMDPDDLQVSGFETEYAATHSDVPARVFLGAGSMGPEFVATHIQK
jgi:predicted alpha/beta superfamily hydrolase